MDELLRDDLVENLVSRFDGRAVWPEQLAIALAWRDAGYITLEIVRSADENWECEEPSDEYVWLASQGPNWESF